MGFTDLRAFLDTLGRADDVVTVEAEVDSHLEAAEIHRRVVAAGGPALLFNNVAGSDFRLVTNLMGTARRAEMAFGERPVQLIRRIVELAETLLPPSAAGGTHKMGCRDWRVRRVLPAQRPLAVQAMPPLGYLLSGSTGGEGGRSPGPCVDCPRVCPCALSHVG